MTRGIHLKTAVDESTGLSGPNDADYQPGRVYDLPLDAIAPDPHQPRVQFAGIEALAAGIEREGFRGAISFRPAEPADGVTTPLVIVDGERRYRACQHLGLATIPALLDPGALAGPDLRYRQATANDLGQPLTQWDWACLIRQLHDEHGLSHAQIARDLADRGLKSWDRSTVANLYRLHQLPEAAQELVKSGWLSAAAGKYVVAIKSADVMERVIANLSKQAGQGLRPATVAEVEGEIYNRYGETAINLDQSLITSAMAARRYETRLFDPSVECKGCLFKHMARAPWNGKKARFCTKPDCHAEKQAAAQAFLATAEGREQEEKEEEAHRQAREEDLALRERKQEEVKALDAARRAALVDQLEDVGVSHVVAILAHLAYCDFLPWDRRQDAPALNQTASRLELDHAATLREIAAQGIRHYANDEHLAQIAELLMVDLEAVGVPRETEEVQLPFLETGT